MMRMFRHKSFLLGSFFLSIIAISIMPAHADGVSGSAGGANSTGADSQLETCAEPLGTLAVHEDQRSDWWHRYYRRYPTLGSTTPLLRLMVQQSNCFVVVERGKAMKEVMGERELEAAGETREGSNFGKGQMVAADFTMSPEIQVSEETGGAKGKLWGKLGGAGDILDSVAGKLKRDEASTTLLLIDNRSSVQIAAAQGTAKKFSFGVGLGIFGSQGGGAASAFTKTPEGKVIAAAFANSYNNMVKALRNYKVQNVDGGLGKGGKLGVGE
ncbi:MAG: CsgG/HfaB family protein [Gammaproteobacteria bacterium]